jgi:putative ABC transport system substrate-binding protein
VRPLVTLTEGSRLPTIFPDVGFVEAGGLMSYGPDFREIHRRTAAIVVKVLKGMPPRDIPVEQPTKFVFGINTKTAKALGLAIDPGAMLRADLLVE